MFILNGIIFNTIKSIKILQNILIKKCILKVLLIVVIMRQDRSCQDLKPTRTQQRDGSSEQLS